MEIYDMVSSTRKSLNVNGEPTVVRESFVRPVCGFSYVP